MSIHYRPEIDGLRALAVLSVMIYHADLTIGGMALFKGGFFGVDVFFVISGFLITSIILQECQRSQSFSYRHFYERRARRILPALLLVILVSLPVAWWMLLPAQLVEFSQSVLSSIFFVSNLFWDHSLQQYGVESALLKPFLHTWSLAVEEQFYIAYPLLLTGLFRWHKQWLWWVLLMVMLLSLQLAQLTTSADQSASFYQLPTRLWELLIGGLLAHRSLHPQRDYAEWFNLLMSALGLLMIMLAVMMIDFQQHHPGHITAIPVLGTALLIHFASKNNWITRLFSVKPLVGIGLISYSLYLWHYPIFAFGRYWHEVPGLLDKTLWILLATSLSIISYKLVEQPFRNPQKVPKKRLVLLLSSMAAVGTVTSLYWWFNDGSKSRLGYLETLLDASNQISVTQNGLPCHSGGSGRKPTFLLDESCVFRQGPIDQNIILIGDSHAAALAAQLQSLAAANSYNFIQYSSAGCRHIQGHEGHTCQQRVAQLSKHISQYPDPIIVYSARIPLFLELDRFVNEKGEKEDNHHPVPQAKIDRLKPLRAAALQQTLEQWATLSDRLVLIYPVPEQGFHVKNKLFRNHSQANGKEDLPTITTSLHRYQERTEYSRQILDRLTANNIIRVYPADIFCNPDTDRCLVSHQDQIYFATDNHVSPLGAAMIVEQVAEKLGLQPTAN